MKNIQDIILKYVKGGSTNEEREQLLDWIRQNPKNRKELFQYKDIWDLQQIGSDELNKDVASQWLLLEKKIRGSRSRTLKFKEILRIAAVILVTLGVGWMGHYFYSTGAFSNKRVEFKQVEAMKGQVKEIFLADGTHVWLNSDSRLSFPSNFTENNRKVGLSGEAFFEVTANEEKPFLVKTKNHTVKVTGTQFNICEYPESKVIETTLVKGKVKIISGNFMNDLLPGQQSSFNTETAIARICKVDFVIYTAWKDGRYEFKNETIGKIFQIVERWWDIKVEYPDEFKNVRISGVLKRYKSANHLFDMIEQLIPVEYEIGNNEIIVKTK